MLTTLHGGREQLPHGISPILPSHGVKSIRFLRCHFLTSQWHGLNSPIWNSPGLREEKQRRLSCSSTDRGDITKEALTPNCDIAKQTTGPWRAWENSIIAREQIDKEKKRTIWALFCSLYLHGTDNFLSCIPTFPGRIRYKRAFSGEHNHKSGSSGSCLFLTSHL